MVVHDLAKILFSVLDNHRALKSLIKAGATLFFFDDVYKKGTQGEKKQV